MKKINLIILSTFVTGVMLLNFHGDEIYIHGQENVDRNIIPLLIPPYQIISEFQSTDLKNFNVTFVYNIP